ncbi:MAG: nucleotidyltransferase family protein [Bacteroidota bacterium]
MIEWKKVLVLSNEPIRDVIKNIDKYATQIAVVVDEDQKLLGVVTDGDIRRGILRGVSLEEPVNLVMNSKPITVQEGASKEQIFSIMRSKQIHQIPVIDKEQRVIRIEFIDELIKPVYRENWVLLMAGGLGSRLRPLTENCPKPLLKVGSKPILETIIENFIEQGFINFYIAVNYMAEMLKNYFGDGSCWGANIKYIHEEKQMGTAGALGLISEKPSHPLIIMNGDLLTKVSFDKLLNFHIRQNTIATMCVRDYQFQVPYGVVNINDNRLVGIVEKPIQQFFVSAGIYVINPEVLDLIPNDVPQDMPELFEKLIKEQKEVAVFPIREYWMDIGRISDFEKANMEYYEQFLSETAATKD